MPLWDGSTLEDFEIVKEWEYENRKYWAIRQGSEIFCCSPLRTKNKFPLIIDELKTLFGIQRIGLHFARVSKNDYLLYYVPLTSKGEVYYETRLSDADRPKDRFFIKKLRELLIFCDIMFLKGTTEKSILLRISGDKIVPIGINDKDIVKEGNNVFSASLYSRWFREEVEPADVLSEMLDNPKDFYEISLDFQEKIEEIICKYDRNYIWYASIIVDKIASVLASKMEPTN